MGTRIVLLRAINVGKRQMPMAELRALCGEIGYEGARTYVASGNLLIGSGETPAAIEAHLGKAISERFGFPVEPIVRDAAAWPAYAAANPFPEASRAHPNLVMMMLSQKPLAEGCAEKIAERATAGEQVKAAGGALWIHFAGGVAPSKLSPSFIDKAIGSPATGRNVRTVQKLGEMAGVL